MLLLMTDSSIQQAKARCDQEYQWWARQFERVLPLVTVHYGGSAAKRTSVDYRQIDVFLTYTASSAIAGLEAFLMTINGHVTPKKTHHVYYTVTRPDGFKIDIVPIDLNRYDTMQASIRHVAFINQHLSDADKSQVINLKRWLMDLDLYGSTDRRGLSGFLTELLVLRFKSLATMKADPSAVAAFLSAPIQDPVEPRRHLEDSFAPWVKNALVSALIEGTPAITTLRNWLPTLCVMRYQYSAAIVRQLNARHKQHIRLHIPFFVLHGSTYILVLTTRDSYQRYVHAAVDFSLADLRRLKAANVLCGIEHGQLLQRVVIQPLTALPVGGVLQSWEQLTQQQRRVIKTRLIHNE